jgi:predicted transcriptional regulator
MSGNLTLTKVLARRVEKLAIATKRTPDAVLKSALAKGLDYEVWFLKQVDTGIAEADRGDLIGHEEVVRNLIYRARPYAVQILRVLHHSRKYP